MNLYLNKKTGNKQSMKKLLVFLFVVLLLCVVNANFVHELTIENIFPNAAVEVFTSTKTNINTLSKLDNGQGEIIFCELNDLDYIIKDIDNCVAGITFKFSRKDIDKKDILSLIKVQTYSMKNYGIYGWSCLFDQIYNQKFNVLIDKNNCNFQLYETKKQIYLGIPLILGGY